MGISTLRLGKNVFKRHHSTIVVMSNTMTSKLSAKPLSWTTRRVRDLEVKVRERIGTVGFPHLFADQSQTATVNLSNDSAMSSVERTEA
jgi:hypothetical protein